MTPWDVLLLAVLLSGKVGHGQSFNWPAAAPATVFWHNVVLLIALMRTCVHMCMPRIRDKQSEVEDIQKKMLGKLSDPLVQHRAVFGEKKYRNIWSHDNTTSSPAAAFWLSLCVCFTNRRANWTLGILVDVVCKNLGDCMCVPRMNSNLHEQQRWILGIFFGSPLLVQHIASFSARRKDMWWSHSAVPVSAKVFVVFP